jgi:hypothetical protein
VKQLLVRLALRYLKPAIAAGVRQARPRAVKYARQHPWLVGTTCVCGVILILIVSLGKNPEERAAIEAATDDVFELVDLGDAAPITDGGAPATLEDRPFVVTADASEPYHAVTAPGSVRTAEFVQSGEQHAEGPVLMVSSQSVSAPPAGLRSTAHQPVANWDAFGSQQPSRQAAWLTGQIEE